MDELHQQLSFLNSSLREEMLEHAVVKDIPKGTEILKDTQYVKVLPLVLSGLVKVYSKFEDKELLLYYIKPQQSCVMSFTAGLRNTPCKVFASTEEDSKLLLIPIEKLSKWLREYPDLSDLFYQQYDLRYSDLLETIQHILLDNMDSRLHHHLKQKAAVSGSDLVKTTHAQIANDLGTVREVISRVMKKLELDGKIEKTADGIKVLP